MKVDSEDDLGKQTKLVDAVDIIMKGIKNWSESVIFPFKDRLGIYIWAVAPRLLWRILRRKAKL